MAINVSVQYDGGFILDIVMLTLCYYHRGTPLNALKRFCLCSPCPHLNVLTFPPPCLGDAQKVLDALRFFKQHLRVNGSVFKGGSKVCPILATNHPGMPVVSTKFGKCPVSSMRPLFLSTFVSNSLQPPPDLPARKNLCPILSNKHTGTYPILSIALKYTTYTMELTFFAPNYEELSVLSAWTQA